MSARGLVLAAVATGAVAWPGTFLTAVRGQDGSAATASGRILALSGPRSRVEPRWAVWSPADERSRAALAEPVRLQRFRTPLHDILSDLDESCDIRIVLDSRAFDDLGVATDTPITISVKNVSLRSALRTMLRPLDLTWAIVDEVLLITSVDQSLEGNFQKIRIYPASDLVAKPSYGPDYDSLITLITKVVEPGSWIDAGGTAVIDVFRGSLVVATTDDVHYEIERLLATLREVVLGDSPSRQRSTVDLSAARGRAVERRRRVRLWRLDEAGNIVWASAGPR